MSDFTDKQRASLAKRGLAMPDGGYPIRNRKDLSNAIQAYGRGKGKDEIKRWIKKRAKELNAVVKQRSKDPTYKKAFEEAYAKQDMGKARRAAERQRKTTDRTEPIKTGVARGVKKAVRAGTKAVTFAATTAAGVAAAYYISHPDEGKAMVNNIIRKASNTVNKARNVARGARFLRKMGL